MGNGVTDFERSLDALGRVWRRDRTTHSAHRAAFGPITMRAHSMYHGQFRCRRFGLRLRLIN
jgi:hypothetical protein